MSSNIGLHELVDLTIPLFDSKDLRTLLHKLIQANVEGMSMAVALTQEVKELKNQLGQKAEKKALEQHGQRLEHLDVVTRELQGKMNAKFVTWDVLQATLVSERQELQKPLMDVGSLMEKYGELEARMELLEASKAEQAQLQQQSDLLPDESHLRDQAASLPADREQESQSSEDEEERTDLATDSESGESPVKQELGCLRNTVHKLGGEVHKLGGEVHKLGGEVHKLRGEVQKLGGEVQKLGAEMQKLGGEVQKLETEEGNVKSRATKDGNMQDQLDKLRSMLEDMMASSSSQEDVSGKQAQLMAPMQRSISKLLGECEKLHSSTHCLMEENSQNQRHIDHLYKSVEELDEKKIDLGQVKVEMEIKADKQALARKVNRMEFDRMTGHLNCMFKEVISKISMQEQDWHKIIQKISTEMESKLNRIELDSLKQELEARWKDLHQQLQAPPAPEPDSAAGFRKQLVDRLHCISCDRPLDMLTSGQNLEAVPSAPRLHGRKSTWPHRILQLEQVRQHCRSPRPRTSCNGFERDPVERSVAQLRPHHMTCQQLEKAPLQSAAAGVSERQQSPGLRGQGRTRLPPIGRTSQSPAKLELVPEKAGSGFSPESRSCGGSHTVTHPSHRGHVAHIYNSGVKTCAPKMGEPRLPIISAKEDISRSKDKVTCTTLKRLAGLELGCLTPVPPQRAKGSCSGSASSARHRPVSFILAQSPNLAEAPTNEPQRGAHNLDLSQSEDEPVTTEFFLTSLSQ